MSDTANTIDTKEMDKYLMALGLLIDGAITSTYPGVDFSTTIMVNMDGWYVKVVGRNAVPYIITIDINRPPVDIAGMVLNDLRSTSFGKRK